MTMVTIALAGLALSAGVLGFLNPCSFALLPAYLSYFLGRGEKGSDEASTARKTLRGAGLGLAATLGFASVFGGIGVIVSFLGSQVRLYIPFLLLMVGPSLIALGAAWLAGTSFLSFTHLGSVEMPRGSVFLFGAAYGLGSLACVFPVFLMVVLTAMSTGGVLSGLSVFALYIAGMGGMMVAVSAAVSLSKEFLVEKFGKARRYVKRAAGVILIAAGIYLIYYWHSTFA
ncbi:hypothetical protein AKJ63_00505 [candidate division MSBL1 archaeon SCGC-AAA259D18]|uniref:Uncharacterized protein n=1 Tax=candidate division MSBL1 archaeon SCGC-AAA259D18 TaxID=1698262 RepID=A0A133UCI2_9EURY|nr:hypothetical protein AKJ63_00505 [candidate division MSBL1 archaeon SCGC-AAA259D18]